jgi:hypothetical protein
MTSSAVDGLGITGPVLILVIAAGLIQVLLQLAALISLYRAPAVMFGNKWVWVIIIVFLSLVGAIVYFAVGRQSAPASEPAPKADVTDAEEKAQSAVDLLYGRKEDE